MQPSRALRPQIGEHATEHSQDGACERLWFAVIKKAVRDLGYMGRYDGAAEQDTQQVEKQRRILKYTPGEFLEGTWFEEIGDRLGQDTGSLRRRYLGGLV